MKLPLRFWIVLATAVASGLMIGYIDTRPTWDDTGITIGSILILGAALGILDPRRHWIHALVLGTVCALLEVLLYGSYAAMVAIPVALLGGSVGSLRTRHIEKPDQMSDISQDDGHA